MKRQPTKSRKTITFYKSSTRKLTRRERPKSTPYLRLKNMQGTTIGTIWIFFQKKYLVRKSHNAEKLKKRSFRLIKRFLQTENFKKMQRGSL